MSLLNLLESGCRERKKLLGVLLDPDKAPQGEKLNEFIHHCENANTDVILIGGSLITVGNIRDLICEVKLRTKIPLLIFPGDSSQICADADGILLLSLISGRNPEYLIGQHVTAAPRLKESGLELLSTGYILVESGTVTTAAYISNTAPIPATKKEIAACTALAGEQLGLKLIYLDGGSGALNPVSAELIRAVKKTVTIPIIVGGGISNAEQAREAWEAGADMIVVGTLFEHKPEAINAFKNR